ncbi:MAG: NAD(P)H-dependent oxidoreductase subunit E [Spirochaetales bacterium]|nr:NAD(P)H-dependent oxidoreductase subunit E [Spirochaetales bacterium]MBQ2125024.1 NAD(P)H-dependent oxidoreductase subunit E [Spirochaetales bacterium]
MEQCCKKGTLPANLYKELDNFIDSLSIKKDDPRRKGFLIQVLHRAQHIFGYLPEELQVYIAEKLSINHSEVSGVISFYNYFTTLPKGKYQISVCMGTACYVKGAQKVLDEFERILKIKPGEVSADMKFSIDALRCVGACGLAPVVQVNGKVYGRVTPQQVQGIVDEYAKGE